jgi:hypothetical protein
MAKKNWIALTKIMTIIKGGHQYIFTTDLYVKTFTKKLVIQQKVIVVCGTK